MRGVVHGTHCLRELCGVRLHFLGVFFPHFEHCVQTSEPLRLGEIRSTPNRPSIRQRHAIQRPPSTTGHQLHSVHVHLVHVWPFFAVDFDAHKMGVHEHSGLLILECFVFHHMAPVAGAVAHAHNHQFVFLARPLPSCFTPRHPIHGIVLVLLQIGRCRLRQGVGVHHLKLTMSHTTIGPASLQGLESTRKGERASQNFARPRPIRLLPGLLGRRFTVRRLLL